MTKTEVYELIVRLTADIKWSGYAKKLFEAAKQEKITEFNQLYKGFMEEYQEIYQQIIWFGEEFNKYLKNAQSKDSYEIFGSKEDKENEVFLFDTDRLDVFSFLVIVIYSGIYEKHLFKSDNMLNVSLLNIAGKLEQKGYTKLSFFVFRYSFSEFLGDEEDKYRNIYLLLTAIERGVFDDADAYLTVN